MDIPPRVSVIIATYNMGSALESALSQTYKDLEVIVVDDGSTDNTQQIMERLLSQQTEYPREIRYILKPHKGKSSALNLGIHNSNGEFVTFLDADDTLPQESIATRVKYLGENPDKDAVFGDTNYKNKEGIIYAVRSPSLFKDELELVRCRNT